METLEYCNACKMEHVKSAMCRKKPRKERRTENSKSKINNIKGET